MRFSAAVCALIVCLAFAGRVWAQCSDYAGCAGQRADAQAKLNEWYRATAQAVQEERRAMATERAYERMMALTATEAARPTRTPTPTPTPVPTLMLVVPSTPIPTMTSTQVVVVVQVVQTIQVTVQAAPEKRTEGASPVGWLIVGTVLLVLLFGAAILLRPQTYMLPFRGGKRDE
mgnify:CR=1 FL=1